MLGIAISVICSSMASFVAYIGQNKEGMEAVTFWLMGSVANARLNSVLLLLLIICGSLLYFMQNWRILNMLLLGQSEAITLGFDLQPYISRFLLINGLLVGFLVYNAGTIGFVGLFIPHISRLFWGTNHKLMLPLAVSFGGLATIVLDIFSRTIITGVEIPLGVIFSLLGAPFFIYLMVQGKYGFGGK